MIFFREQLDRLSSFSRNGIAWIIRQFYWILYIVSYPIVRILFTCLAVMVMANMMYVALKVMFSPVGVVREEVYFDYLHEGGPTATIALATADQQWQLGPAEPLPSLCDNHPTFFDKNTEYDVTLTFTLARSTRNLELGKAMVYSTLQNCRGEQVASSARSFHLPFQSSLVLQTDSLLRLPLYLANLFHESEAVQVVVLRGFLDASSSSLLPALSLRVALSSNAAKMDIESTVLSIDPRPKGLAYLFYVFPFSSFIAINVMFVTLFLMSSCCLSWMGYTIQSSAATPSPSDNLDDDNGNGDSAEFGDGLSDSCSDSEASVYDDDYNDVQQRVSDENNLNTHSTPGGDSEQLTSSGTSTMRQRRIY